MDKLGLTTIILTYNEELHIQRALDNVASISSKVYVIDSPSTDKTQEICSKYNNVEVVVHKYPGNQAEQFNWALDNLHIDTEWILRLDADEYLLPELIEELQERLPNVPDDVNGIVLKRRHIFMDRWMKHGIYPVKMLRIFRSGKGRCEQKFMDEHIRIFEGETLEMNNDFCDHNLNNLSWFCQKHVNYAVREAADLLDLEFNINGTAIANEHKKLSPQAFAKRKKKHSYARKPLFWRAFAYFLYRYFFRGGCKDGKEGFIFTFIQGWWYRTLVDAKIYEIKNKCGADKDKIVELFKTEYDISL